MARGQHAAGRNGELEHDGLELNRFAVSAKHQRSRVRDAAQRPISAFTRVFDTLWAVHRRAWTQNRKNNPMQSRIGPARSSCAALRPRARGEKWSVVTAPPNLIPPIFLFEHDLFGKPVPTFPDHAPGGKSKGLRKSGYVAAGFFFALGLAVFGSATGSGPRSIEVSRPAVKV
jgi:hypothetical protein